MKRLALLALLALVAAPAQAQDHMDHGMAAMDHGEHAMPPMDMRESSGTAWQPASSPMDGMHFMAGDWHLMAHGFVTAIYDDQGGPRGGDKVFSTSMAMLMGTRPLSARDRLSLRGMASLDALMGKRGYPLLFAVGETADGVDTLVDRQHPHDLLMELSATWTHDLGGGNSFSLYAGLPGEPALGPPTFMHRVSGMMNPEAPIAHHWFDSTHITFGVATAGFATRTWKLEASLFTGREPDQHRWDNDKPRFDNWSARLTVNPTDDLSLQVSRGRLKSPEQLHPNQDETRTTASATWNKPIGDGSNWATTATWSSKDLTGEAPLHALLLESSLTLKGRDTVFARAEQVRQAELFHNGPLAGTRSTVGRLSAGYVRTWPLQGAVKLDLGGLLSAYAYPAKIEPAYGKDGLKSFMLFARLKLAD